MKRSFFYKFLIICLVVSGITGCDIIEKLKGDSKSSVPPSLPDLQLVQPNVDFFTTEFTEQVLEDTSGYELASLLINIDFNPFVQSIYNYLPFLEAANQSEPESADEGWEWNYNHIHEGQQYEIQLTSKRVEDTSVRDTWTLYISYSALDLTVESYKFMELTIDKDRRRGYWIIYPPEFQNPNANFPPFLSLSWESYNINNTEYYYEFHPYSPDSNEEIQAGYIINDLSDFKFNRSIHMFMENAEFEVKRYNTGWDNNTKEGYVNYSYKDYKQGGSNFETTICWDGNLNDTECQF